MTASQERRKPERGKHNISVKELFRLEDIKLNWTTVRRAVRLLASSCSSVYHKFGGLQGLNTRTITMWIFFLFG